MKKFGIWVKATRPKTLAASLSPVLIGSAIAYYDNSLEINYFLLISFIALLIQISVNFINEIYDYKKGADTVERLGPTRAVATGLISSRQMTIASIIIVSIAFLLGLILVAKAGYIIFIIGVLSLIFAWAYTGGPYPLAYNGLAELFVFIFFGILAVNGTYYVFTREFSEIVFISSIMPGFLSTNLLLVNNIRDIDTDKKVGKNTLAVKLGKEKSCLLVLILNILVCLTPFLLFILVKNLWLLLPLILIPFQLITILKLYGSRGKSLNNVLAMNGLLVLLNGLLTAISFIIAKQNFTIN